MHAFALEAEAHAVAAVGDAVLGVEKAPAVNVIESVLLVAGNYAQQRIAGVGRSFRFGEPLMPSARRRRARQIVAGAQLVAVDAADLLAHDGCRAAELRRDREAAGDRDVAARAGGREADLEPPAGLDIVGPPLLDRATVELARRIRAGDRERGRDFGVELEAAEADLDAGRVGVVVEQAVGPVEGAQVERPAGGEPEAVRAVAAAVLQQAQQSRLADPEAAHSVPPRSRYRCLSIASKRTRSPTFTGMLGSRSGSNMRVGQRPIRFQPPGDSAG